MSGSDRRSADLVQVPASVEERPASIAGEEPTVRVLPRPELTTPLTAGDARGARSGRVAGVLSAVAGLFGRVRRRVFGRTQLRRVPWILAAGVALVSAVAGSSVCSRAAHDRRERAWIQLNADAESRSAHIVTMLAGGPSFDDAYSYVVDPKAKTFRSLGKSDIDPPVFQYAAEAQADPTLNYFSQRGRNFIASTRRIDDSKVAIAILDTGWWTSQGNNAAGHVWRRGLLAWIALIAATAALARWLLRPAINTLAEQHDFLADAAHEMRTPLAVIQASAGHALHRARSAEEYVRSLAEIRSAAERAATGVTELLDLARFDAGQAMPRVAPLRLDLLAEEVVAATRVDGCEIVNTVGPSVLVDGDMALLRQAIDNVVRNASARATRVTLRAYLEGRDGVLEVVDDGPGFSAEQLPYVFERFRRSDRKGSSGLGLAIVQSVMTAHGGAAEARNGPSGGACIVLRVPRSRLSR